MLDLFAVTYIVAMLGLWASVAVRIFVENDIPTWGQLAQVLVVSIIPIVNVTVLFLVASDLEFWNKPIVRRKP